MIIFLMLHALWRPKEKNSLSYLSGVCRVGLFLKRESVLPHLATAPIAKKHTLKDQHTGSARRTKIADLRCAGTPIDRPMPEAAFSMVKNLTDQQLEIVSIHIFASRFPIKSP